MTPAARIIKHPLAWLAVVAALMTATGLVVWMRADHLRLWHALSRVEVIAGTVRVCGIVIGPGTPRAFNGRWEIYGDHPGGAVATCAWGERSASPENRGLEIRGLESLFSQAISTMRHKVGREPEYHRLVDVKGICGCAAIWRVGDASMSVQAERREDGHRLLRLVVRSDDIAANPYPGSVFFMEPVTESEANVILRR